MSEGHRGDTGVKGKRRDTGIWTSTQRRCGQICLRINPRTLTMGVIPPEEFYGGHFQIDLPLSGGVQSKEQQRILRGLILALCKIISN